MKLSRHVTLAGALVAASFSSLTAAASPEPTQSATEISATGRDQGMDVSRAKDGMFYVDADIDGKIIRFLVDTGANFVVLNAADFARLGILGQPDLFGPQMATAGGNTPMAWATIDHVRLAGRDASDIKAAVVKTGLPVSLLGEDMLCKLESVTIEGDHLHLR